MDADDQLNRRPAMSPVTVIKIEPDGLYDDIMVYRATEIAPRTLAAARKAGKLKSTRAGNRVLYLGRWLLDWLTNEDEA